MVSGDPHIIFARRFHAALAYHVLSHLDLGRDAASLFDPRLPQKSWTGRLELAYQAAPGRLAVQFVALEAEDLQALLGRLEAWPAILTAEPPSFPSPSPRTAQVGSLEPLERASRASAVSSFRASGDPADRALAKAFGAALIEETAPYLERHSNAPGAEARIRSASAALTPPLRELRAALWENKGPVPPLTVLDCPALGPRGRGARIGGRRVVAVSLGQPFGHVICQIFHEEVHPVTDPIALESVGVEARDTRVDRAGFRVHSALEEAAVEVGRAVIEARKPELEAAYEAWCARFSGARSDDAGKGPHG